MEYPGISTGTMILNEDGQVLLGLRLKENAWSFPGGKVDMGESFIESAKREVQEECNLEVSDLDLVCLVNDFLEDKHFALLGFKAVSCSGDVQNNELDNFQEWKWFDLDNLPENIFGPTRNIMNAMQSNQFFVDKK